MSGYKGLGETGFKRVERVVCRLDGAQEWLGEVVGKKSG